MIFATTILTSWAACPQSRLYQDVVARGEKRSLRQLTRVARQWDHTLAPAWMTRLVPRRLQPAPFDPEEYGDVVAGLSVATLSDTLEHVAWLRTQACVRRSLRSIAFLESFETVVADELEQRARCAAGTAPGWPQPRPTTGAELRCWPAADAERRVSP